MCGDALGQIFAFLQGKTAVVEIERVVEVEVVARIVRLSFGTCIVVVAASAKTEEMVESTLVWQLSQLVAYVPFARHQSCVSGLLKHFAKCERLLVQVTLIRRQSEVNIKVSYSCFVRELSGYERCPCRGTDRVVVELAEAYTLACQTVEVWSVYFRCSVGTYVREAEVIDQDEYDVWTLFVLLCAGHSRH